MDWSKLPDLIAMGLLASAFASVARHSHTRVSAHWLVGWIFIVLHFVAFMFSPLQGWAGTAGVLVGVLMLVWAAILFMRASVPYREEKYSHVMFFVLLATYTAYISALMLETPPAVLTASAVALGVAPVGAWLLHIRRCNHPLRLLTVGLQLALMVVLLLVQGRPSGSDFALNAILFTVYFSTTVHFWNAYRRMTAGALISTIGFLLWANVFVVAPAIAAWYPQVHLESEVWNLPKYIVAIGMILVLLEDQIAHNKHLALHDALTGLPNRRLFEDRLSNAIERARRTGTQTALLMVDLNHFKQVNDSLGHHMGDLLLQEVARLFSGRVRRSDTVARTGGDEFAIVLDGPTSRPEAKHVGRTLLDLLNQPMQIENRTVCVGASLGIAIFPEDARDFESLCIKADLRMYDDKRGTESEVPHRPVGSVAPMARMSHPESETARF